MVTSVTSVKKIYNEAIEKLGDNDDRLHFGPAHLVWEDGNMHPDNISFCVNNFNQWVDGFTDHEKFVVMESLAKLLALYATGDFWDKANNYGE